MKVLVVHCFYGKDTGENVTVDGEVEALVDHGVTVQLFSVRQAGSSAFRLYADLLAHKPKRRLLNAIREFCPDIIHVHNVFPFLGYGIFRAIQSAHPSTPVIATIHNYRLQCVSGTLFRQKELCRLCQGKLFPISGIKYRCYRNSTLYSLIGQTILFTAKLNNVFNYLDAVIYLSGIQKRLLEDIGPIPKRSYIRGNSFGQLPLNANSEAREGFLYVGRLSDEKGIMELLDAWPEAFDVKLTIVGDGPLKKSVGLRCQGRPNIRFIGQVSRDRALSLMGQSEAIVVPSLWDEPFGRIAIEANAMGTPFISLERGALPEIASATGGGVMAPSLSRVSIAASVNTIRKNQLSSDSIKASCIRQFSSDKMTSSLIDIYGDVIDEKRARRQCL